MKIYLLLFMSFSLLFCENKKPETKIDFELIVNNKNGIGVIKDSLFFETLVVINAVRNELIANEKQEGVFKKDYYCLITVVRENYGEILNKNLTALSNRTGKDYLKTFDFYKDCNYAKNLNEALLFLTILERDILIDYVKVGMNK